MFGNQTGLLIIDYIISLYFVIYLSFFYKFFMEIDGESDGSVDYWLHYIIIFWNTFSTFLYFFREIDAGSDGAVDNWLAWRRIPTFSSSDRLSWTLFIKERAGIFRFIHVLALQQGPDWFSAPTNIQYE